MLRRGRDGAGCYQSRAPSYCCHPGFFAAPRVVVDVVKGRRCLATKGLSGEAAIMKAGVVGRQPVRK